MRTHGWRNLDNSSYAKWSCRSGIPSRRRVPRLHQIVKLAGGAVKCVGMFHVLGNLIVAFSGAVEPAGDGVSYESRDYNNVSEWNAMC
jgi:hypothetical protein